MKTKQKESKRVESHGKVATCPDDGYSLNENKAMCHPKCPDGLELQGNYCVQPCPSGFEGAPALGCKRPVEDRPYKSLDEVGVYA
jgi:hypothetical protein